MAQTAETAWLIVRVAGIPLAVPALETDGIVMPPAAAARHMIPGSDEVLFPLGHETFRLTDLRRRLGVFAEPESGRVILWHSGRQPCALQVDAVIGMTSDVQAAPLPSDLPRTVFDQAFRHQETLVLCSTPARLLRLHEAGGLQRYRQAPADAPPESSSDARQELASPRDSTPANPRTQPVQPPSPAFAPEPPPSAAPAGQGQPRARRPAPENAAKPEIHSPTAPAPTARPLPGPARHSPSRTTAPAAPLSPEQRAPAPSQPHSVAPPPGAADPPPLPATPKPQLRDRTEAARPPGPTPGPRGAPGTNREDRLLVGLLSLALLTALGTTGWYLWPAATPPVILPQQAEIAPRSAPPVPAPLPEAAPPAARPETPARPAAPPDSPPGTLQAAPNGRIQVERSDRGLEIIVDHEAASGTGPEPGPALPNETAPPTPDRPASPAKRVVVHTVVPGDTLWDIAARYINNPWAFQAIAEQSGVSDPDWIYPGDEIRILFRNGTGPPAEQ